MGVAVMAGPVVVIDGETAVDVTTGVVVAAIVAASQQSALQSTLEGSHLRLATTVMAPFMLLWNAQ